MRALTRLAMAPIRSLSSVLLAMLVVACMASPGDRLALNEARAAVERARGEPRVRALAAAELDRAELALQRAEAAAKAGAPADRVDHLAYVASRQAALAQAHALDRVAQAEIEVLQRALGQDHADSPTDAVQQERRVREAALATPIEATAPELTLSLAELPFEDAELSREVARRLGDMAERLSREPWRTVSIEADFNLPDPVARTTVERRIETVRAELLGRGVEASRIIVRASAPSKERAAASFDDPSR